MPQGFIKSPLNYIGGKYRLLPQILPLFPRNIRCFVDLFAGGLNVALNISAERIIANDNLRYLIDFYKILQRKSLNDVLAHIYRRIDEYSLSLENVAGYDALRMYYNIERDPLDLFVLISYSFNHQIRFNAAHEFNNPFGRARSRYNSYIEKNLKKFIAKLHKSSVEFRSQDFNSFDFSGLGRGDFVYCDPPYLISTGSYNDGKRGFGGWTGAHERALLGKLDYLHQRGVSFALSNIISHKGIENGILLAWLAERPYFVSDIEKDYSNANYQVKLRDKSVTQEVLITNYTPKQALYMLPLFRQAL